MIPRKPLPHSESAPQPSDNQAPAVTHPLLGYKVHLSMDQLPLPVKLSLCKQLRAGQMGEAELEDLLQALAPLYSEQSPQQPASEADEEAAARKLWQRASTLPDDERRHCLLEPSFSTPALFELLSQQSREAGRKQRQLAVPLAELALESLDRIDRRSLRADERAGLRALGYARLATCRRMAFDLAGAETALERAECLLQGVADQERARFEIDRVTAALRWEQRHLSLALQRVDMALQRMPELISKGEISLDEKVRTLLLSGDIRGDAGDIEAALATLRHACTLAEQAEDPRLTLMAYQNLAAACAHSGALDEALALLPAARRMVRELKAHEIEPTLDWVEAYVAREQGRLDLAARIFERLRDLLLHRGQRGDAALLTLELALVALRRGEVDAGFRLAQEAVPTLERFSFQREVIAALAALKQALAASGKVLATQELSAAEASHAGDLTAQACRVARPFLWRLRP